MENVIKTVTGRAWIKYLRLVLGVLFITLGAYLASQSHKLGYFVDGSPGPGFFPYWIGLFIVVVAFFWTIAEFRENINDQVEQDLDPKGIYRVARLLLSMMALTFFFVPLGYNLSVLLFMLFLTATMGKGKVLTNIIVSLVFSFGIYLAFEKILDVPLPSSILPLLAHLGL